MTLLRLGTRGSELALVQTRLACAQLKLLDPAIRFEEVIIKTHGDIETEAPLDARWPAGGFVGAIEQALLRGDIDLAVHSAKDLPAADTSGLAVAAVPPREVPHDVLISREPLPSGPLPTAFRVGTGSPRRAAQLRRFLGDPTVIPIRGNVPTRLEKLARGEFDAVVLAAAGLRRLGLAPPHARDLPVDRFVPAAAQGALALQARSGDRAALVAAAIDHAPSHRAVDAERAFLRGVNAGCHTPVGALAVIENDAVRLHGQLFSDDGSRMVEGVEIDPSPNAAGRRLADRLVRDLHGTS